MKRHDQFYDNTMLSSYKDCPRKYFLRHVLDWRREGTAPPLVFGLSWHSGMDAVWQHFGKVPEDNLVDLAMAMFLETWEAEGFDPNPVGEIAEKLNPRLPQVAREMYENYIRDRANTIRNSELVAVEQPFAVPIPDLEAVWYVGRLDKVARIQGQLTVVEHKTTTAYKLDGGFQTSYIEGWYSDSQVKGYQFGGSLFYPGLTQVWVDAALVHKKVHDKFRFVPVAHNTEILKEWVGDTREWVLRLQEDRHKFDAAGGALVPGCFPKNENTCMGKFGACGFLDICRTTANPDQLGEPPAGYVVEPWSPFDTLNIEKLLEAQ